ncbi:MAG: efflux RND transporter periplasmic adaptor subunit [Nitrospinae bacterium]|nr:efflux RND transporter periplasmic adaptor subunit [Nitrospinota bacterium]
MKKFAVAFILLAVAAGLGFYYYSSNAAKETGALILFGNVEVTEVDLGFKAPGRIAEIFTDEGRRVSEGEMLAKLESAELEKTVEQAMAALDEALARLDEISAGSRKQDIAQASASIAQAKAELDKTEKELKRAVFLHDSGAISAQKLEEAQRGRDVSFNIHKKTVEAHSLAVEGPRKESIVAAKARVRQAEAALSLASERLKDATLYSPVSGITLRRNMEPGESAGVGAPVATIADLQHPWVRVYVKEDKLNTVKIGQRAFVTVDSYPGKVFEGTVSHIASEAEFTPKNIQTKEERVKLVFAMKVAVKNDGLELKPGMPADVRLDAGGRG